MLECLSKSKLLQGSFVLLLVVGGGGGGGAHHRLCGNYWLTLPGFFNFPHTLQTCLGELKGLFSIVLLNRLTDLERRQMESGGLIRPLPTRGMPPPGNPAFLFLLNLAISTKTS